MMTTKIMPVAANNDAELVGQTLAGNRDAFSQIVSRYQSLICSLAYSATGSLGQSEDLAQETFITAWKHLARLRERDKLRAWLCGIARNRINSFHRREGREPNHRAESLEEISETHAPEPLPVEYTISNEEQAILWRSLEKIPEIYREPLVLFYREHQSIETVAEKLELTEDAVKQRLSRGRKMLHEQVLAFVEGALERISPGKNFTQGVVAALPMAAASAKVATVGAAIAKGGMTAKSVLTVGAMGGFFAMLGGALVTMKAHFDDSKSPRERQFMLQHFGRRMCVTVVLLAALLGFLRLEYFHAPLHLCWGVAVLGFLTALHSTVVLPRYARRRRQIQIEDGTFDEAEWMAPRKLTDARPGGAEIQNDGRMKTLKFMAAGIGMSIYVLWQQPWNNGRTHAILWLALVAFCFIRGLQRWRNSPRFLDFRGYNLFVPVFFGLGTLAVFNWHQYLARFGTDSFSSISSGEAMAFNGIVVLAYAALLAVLLWKRQAGCNPIV